MFSEKLGCNPNQAKLPITFCHSQFDILHEKLSTWSSYLPQKLFLILTSGKLQVILIINVAKIS